MTHVGPRRARGELGPALVDDQERLARPRAGVILSAVAELRDLPGEEVSQAQAGRAAAIRSAAVTARIADRVRSLYGLTHTLAAPLHNETGVIGAIVLSQRSGKLSEASETVSSSGKGDD